MRRLELPPASACWLSAAHSHFANTLEFKTMCTLTEFSYRDTASKKVTIVRDAITAQDGAPFFAPS